MVAEGKPTEHKGSMHVSRRPKIQTEAMVSRGNTRREEAEVILRSVGVLGENSQGAPPNNVH